MDQPVIVLKPEVDAQGYIRLGGVVIGRYIEERQTIQIKDSHPVRSRCRGTCFVECRIEDFQTIASQ